MLIIKIFVYFHKSFLDFNFSSSGPDEIICGKLQLPLNVMSLPAAAIGQVYMIFAGGIDLFVNTVIFIASVIIGYFIRPVSRSGIGSMQTVVRYSNSEKVYDISFNHGFAIHLHNLLDAVEKMYSAHIVLNEKKLQRLNQ